VLKRLWIESHKTVPFINDWHFKDALKSVSLKASEFYENNDTRKMHMKIGKGNTQRNKYRKISEKIAIVITAALLIRPGNQYGCQRRAYKSGSRKWKPGTSDSGCRVQRGISNAGLS